MSQLNNFGTPEDLLTLRSDLPAGVMISAIECALQRAESVLSLLSPYFDGQISDGGMPSSFVIANAIWSVEGELENIRKLAHHAYDSESAIKLANDKPASGA